ncbi:hypothetical protein NC796_09750 [Aliifodinibius sp. S!AR15-10]|uniref:hypothetical protein n=1 Tax=Aliifodinibius sp. S!AR15-10 TaxID=2950437 RepID=UPI0028554CA5|nr:hypothetical protein [Aliifodinibius sp. S!AR15-10]MDR8391422.1 hypothetical protein [Aliifodinibius sp. S!AR15-10]
MKKKSVIFLVERSALQVSFTSAGDSFIFFIAIKMNTSALEKATDEGSLKYSRNRSAFFKYNTMF